MRSKWVTGLAVLMVIGTASGVAADVLKGELMFTPRFSLGIPVGDYPITGPGWREFRDDINVGFALGGMIEKVVSNRVSLGMQVNYNISTITVKDTAILNAMQRARTKPDLGWKTIQLTGHLRYHFSPASPVSFFAHVGAGLYMNKFSKNLDIGGYGIVVTQKASDTRTDLGVSLGPGILVRLSPATRLSFEALLNNAFTKHNSTRFMNFTAGLVFRIPTD
jgi:hypothetical protein